MASTITQLSLTNVDLVTPEGQQQFITQLNLLLRQIEDAIDAINGLHGPVTIQNTLTVKGDLHYTGSLLHP